jgi:AdoMet-dependent heme synthase
MKNPTVIWRAKQTDNALSTYEAYKLIDEIATLEPARFVMTEADRDDLFQILNYAQRRHIPPAFRLPAQSSPQDVRALARNGAATMVFRIDSTMRERHDVAHGNGSYTNTLQSMRFAAEQKIAIEVETLVSHKTLAELPMLADLIATFGARTWNVLFPVPPLARGVEMLTAAEAEIALDTLSKIALDVRTVEAPHIIRYRGIPLRDVVFIDAAGQVRPSEYAAISSGSSRYRRLRNLVASPVFANFANPANLHGKCSRCEFRAACGGSRARAWAMTGDLYAADPLCSYQPAAS